MKTLILIGTVFALGAPLSIAQDNKRNKPLEAHPQAVGDAGIAWYTTWDTGIAEAERSNRPVLFMAAATCEVPGAF